MKTDDLENELRNLKFVHLTERELAAYCDQKLDPPSRARVEAHLKQCFICERQLELMRKESAALSNRVVTAESVELADRLMKQNGSAQETPVADPAEMAREIPLQERLAEYLRQLVASWQIYFKQLAVRRGADPVWQWQSEDGRLQAHAIMENSDLMIYFSSSEIDLEGTHLNIRLGLLNEKITLRRVSESEVAAKIAILWQYRQRNLDDISIEIG